MSDLSEYSFIPPAVIIDDTGIPPYILTEVDTQLFDRSENFEELKYDNLLFKCQFHS